MPGFGDGLLDDMATDTATIDEKQDTAIATDVTETPRRSLAAWVSMLSNRDRILMGAGGAGAVLAWVLVSTLTGGEPAPTTEPAPEIPTAFSPPPKADPQLTPGEYLDLAKGAVKEARLPDARRHLERALGLGSSGPGSDASLRAELCRLMADVCHRTNQPHAAALYREQAASLMSGLDGTALAVFELAEADLAAGNVRAARRRYHAIALGGGQGGPSEAKLRGEAERRLARTYEAEFEASRQGELDRVFDPKVFDEGGS